MTNLLKISFLFISILLLNACGGDGADAELNKAIREKSKDGQIDGSEWTALQTEFKKNCADLEAKIKEVMGGSRKGIPTLAPCTDEPLDVNNNNGNTSKNSTSNEFHIYVENSASMFGYMEGATDFREVLMDLPSRIADKGGKNSFYFINDKSYPITEDFRSFISSLDVAKARKYGKTDVSELDKMLDTIAMKVIRSKENALFVSDFIYDVKNKNPKDDLIALKFKIKDICQKLKNANDYGILVIKCTSKFKGTYYDCKDKKTALDTRRPYYIWVIGSVPMLKEFDNTYLINNLAGFETASLFYEIPKDAPASYASILPQTEAIGNFNRPRGNSGSAVTTLEEVSGDERKNHTIQFALALDLKDIPAEDSYLTTPTNYSIDSDLPIQITSIRKISEVSLHKNDERFKGSATHVLLVSTTAKLSKEAHSIKIALNKTNPDWVNNSSSEDDSNVKSELDKTFGLRYLIEGISEAYAPKGTMPVFSSWEITLKK